MCRGKHNVYKRRCEIRLGEWRCSTCIRLAARHDLDCYLEGVDSDSWCSDSLDFINTHLISAIGDILGIVQLDFGYAK